MFKLISVLLIVSQCCSPSVFGSPIKDGNCPHYQEMELERLKSFVEELTKTFATGVEPCDDYVSYVDGHGEGTTDYMEGISRQTVKNMFADYFNDDSHLSSTEKKAKKLYEMCLAKKDDDFLETVKDLHNDKIRHIPPGVAAWNKDKFVLPASLGTFNRMGHRVVFEFVADTEGDKIVFYLQPKALDLKHETEPEDFVKLFEYFGFTNDDISAVRTDHAELKQHIQAIDTSEEYQLVKIDWLEEHIPDFNWAEYFDIIGSGTIKESDEVYVKTDAVKHLIELLSKTDKSKIVNYVLYSVHRELYVGQQNMLGKDEEKCYNEVFWFFPEVLINVAIKEYLDDHDRVNFINVTQSVLDALKDHKPGFFKSRHNKFIKVVTDPTSYENNIEKLYKDIEVSSDNYFTNLLQITYDTSKYNVLNPNAFDFSQYIMKNLRHNHKKPRIFMVYSIATEITYISPALENEGQKCMDMVHQQKNFKSALKALEYLKESNEELFEVEKEFLEKYELNQNKVLLKLLTEYFIDRDREFTTTKKSELQNLIFSLDTFLSEYKCPADKLFKLDDKIISADYCLA